MFELRWFDRKTEYTKSLANFTTTHRVLQYRNLLEAENLAVKPKWSEWKDVPVEIDND